MASVPPEGRSKQIADASAQYVIHRWGSLRPALTRDALALVGATLMLLAIGVGHSDLPNAKTWQSVLFIPAIASYVVHLWMQRHRLRHPIRSARERALRMQQEAGVVVAEPSPRRIGWWLWPLAFGVVPAYFMGVLWLSAESPERFQPLVFVVGLTLLGLVVRAAMDARARSYWRPVSFLGWSLYGAYAVAVATGLLQPLVAVSAPWRYLAWPLGTIAPLVGFILVQVIVSECYSRLQFRRLQRLVNESAPPEGTDGAD